MIWNICNRLSLGGEEIVKFLQDVLDALFSMFVTEDGNSTAHSGQVFHALVHILATLQDPKYEHFQSVIDAYINDHFAAALVYKVTDTYLISKYQSNNKQSHCWKICYEKYWELKFFENLS